LSLVTTTAKDIGAFLEEQARKGEPITYGRQVVEHFPDLPPLTDAWLAHPLCDMFGQLDAKDHAAGLPFLTAFVYGKQASMPGDGFFKTILNYRKKKIGPNQRMTYWLTEVQAVKERYKE
jgi:hypothetical protein